MPVGEDWSSAGTRRCSGQALPKRACKSGSSYPSTSAALARTTVVETSHKPLAEPVAIAVPMHTSEKPT